MSPCLSPQALGRLIIDEGSRDEKNHLRGCALCQHALANLKERLDPPRACPPPAFVFDRLQEAIAREVVSEAEAQPKLQPARAPIVDPALWRWATQTLAAAMILVATFVGLILVFAKDSPPAAFIYSLY